MHLNFKNEWRPLGPKSPNYSIYLIKLLSCYSYPGGNFDENQLPDDSISLSPLLPSMSIDLHVRTLSNFHLSFNRLHPSQQKITVFRVQSTWIPIKTVSAMRRVRCNVREFLYAPSIVSLSFRWWVFHSKPFHVLW